MCFSKGFVNKNKHWNRWADISNEWEHRGDWSACKHWGESRGQVLIKWMSCSANLRLFQGSWRLSCYFSNFSVPLVICLPLSSLAANKAAASDARLHCGATEREPESKHRSKSCIQWGQGRGTARNLVFLLASTKFTQTLFLFFREANGMFSGLPTLPTLKDLNHTLHGYLCVTAFAGFPSPYVWPWKPEKTNVGCHIFFIMVHIFIFTLTDSGYCFIQNRWVSFLIGEKMSQKF